MSAGDQIQEIAEKLGPSGAFIMMFSISGGFYFQIDNSRPADELLAWGTVGFMMLSGICFFTRAIWQWPNLKDFDPRDR